MDARRRPHTARRPSDGAAPAVSPRRVRLWAHGRFGYQDVVLLLFPLVGLSLLLLSTVVLPVYFANAPRQAGTVVVSACEYFEDDRRDYKCTGSFTPDAGTSLTPPPHLWVSEGDLPPAGSVRQADLFADDTLRVGGEDPVDPFLALGVILSAVGLPIVIIYLRNLLRYRSLRRRYPGADVIDRRGWPSASAESETAREVLRSRAVSNRRASRVLLALAAVGLVGVGGVMAWQSFAPGRVAASVTVDWCTDSADLSGPGMRPLVTCAATAEDGTVMEFSPQGRKYLEPGTRVTGHVVDGRFVDRSGGVGAEPLLAALIVLAVACVLVGLVVRSNTMELGRLTTPDNVK